MPYLPSSMSLSSPRILPNPCHGRLATAEGEEYRVRISAGHTCHRHPLRSQGLKRPPSICPRRVSRSRMRRSFWEDTDVQIFSDDCRPRPILPATQFLPSADPRNSNREATPVPQCSPPTPPVKRPSPSCEAHQTGGSYNSARRQFTVELPPVICHTAAS